MDIKTEVTNLILHKDEEMKRPSQMYLNYRQKGIYKPSSSGHFG